MQKSLQRMTFIILPKLPLFQIKLSFPWGKRGEVMLFYYLDNMKVFSK